MILKLFFLMPFASIAAIFFTPAFPEIAKVFGVSESGSSFAMTLFLLGYAFGNLPYGPMAKRCGRKNTAYFGIGLTVLGTLIILFSQNSWSLFLFGRLITALGSSVGMKITYTILGDLYTGHQMTRAMSLITPSFVLAPGVFVALGGFLTDAFGWESIFIVQLMYCLVLFAIVYSMPETGHKEKIGNVVQHLYKGFQNRTLIKGACMMGCVGTVTYLFSTVSPFIVIEKMRVSPSLYGVLSAIPPLGMLLGAFASFVFAGRLAREKVMALGVWIALLCSLLTTGLFLVTTPSIALFFFPIPFIYFGGSLMFNSVSALVMEHVQDKASGSAVMGFLNMAFVTCGISFAGLITTPFMLAVAFSILSAGTLFLSQRLDTR